MNSLNNAAPMRAASLVFFARLFTSITVLKSSHLLLARYLGTLEM